MGQIKINKDRCKGCGLCIIYCPRSLLCISGDLNNKGIHAVDIEDKDGKCTGCGMCAVICPDCAIEVWR